MKARISHVIVTPDHIFWTKEALEKLEPTDLGDLMITSISISIEAAIQADIHLNLSAEYGLSAYEFFCSDMFVNHYGNQLAILNYVISNNLQWK